MPRGATIPLRTHMCIYALKNPSRHKHFKCPPKPKCFPIWLSSIAPYFHKLLSCKKKCSIIQKKKIKRYSSRYTQLKDIETALTANKSTVWGFLHYDFSLPLNSANSHLKVTFLWFVNFQTIFRLTALHASSNNIDSTKILGKLVKMANFPKKMRYFEASQLFAEELWSDRWLWSLQSSLASQQPGSESI